MMRTLRVILLAVLILTIRGQPAFPQSDDPKALRQEIDALKEEQRALRTELQELVNSLRERGGPTTRDVRDRRSASATAPPRGATPPCSPPSGCRPGRAASRAPTAA